MTETEFIVCNLLFKKYFHQQHPIEPHKIYLEPSRYDLLKYTRVLRDLNLLNETHGVGGYDKYQITTKARQLQSSGLRTFFLREGLLKSSSLSDSWSLKSTSQKIKIIGITIGSILTIIGLVINLILCN